MGAEPATVQMNMEQKPLPTTLRNATVLLRSEADRVNLASAFKPIDGTDFYMTLRPLTFAGRFTRSGEPPAVLIVDIDVSDGDDINYIRALRAGPLSHV